MCLTKIVGTDAIYVHPATQPRREQAVTEWHSTAKTVHKRASIGCFWYLLRVGPIRL
jgi:hypothetical protein